MRKLLFALIFFPFLSSAQLQSISLNCAGMGISENEEYNTVINRMLQTTSLTFQSTDKIKTIIDVDGSRHITLQQQNNGIPVENAVIKLHYKDGELYFINGEFALHFKESPATLSEQEAFVLAKKSVNASKFIWDDPEELNALARLPNTEMIYPSPKSEIVFYSGHGDPSAVFTKAYKFDIMSLIPYGRSIVYVDAGTDNILGKNSIVSESNAATRYSGTRSICTTYDGAKYVLREGNYACTIGLGGVQTYNMLHLGNYAAAVDFQDADDNWTAAEFHNSNKDDAGLEAHWAIERSMSYYNFVLGRNSWDNFGSPVFAYVNANLPLINSSYSNVNAFWDGSRITYGLGTSDPIVALDITGHELGHAMLQSIIGYMTQSGEPGAINEALSDMWGSTIESISAPTKQRWLIGEDVVSGGFRNMQNPLATGNPKFYGGTNWISTSGCVPDQYNDYCGIHNNSTVLDYWFYLMVASPYPGIGYIGEPGAQNIVFRAETLYLTSSADFNAFRNYTIQAARDLYGDCSSEVKRTINAWADVGLGSGTPSISSSLYLTTPISGASNYLAGSITAVNQVTSGAIVKYEALQKIELNPGFRADNNSTFLARIVGCKDVYNRPANPSGNIGDPFDGSEIHGLEKAHRTPEWTLSPNPATSYAVLNSNEDLSKATVSVYDLNGKAQDVRVTIKENNQALITWKGLAPGIYLVKVLTNDYINTFKLIIQNPY